METSDLAYELARRYVSDCSTYLRPGLADQLLGYIRSRRFDLLAGCCDLVTPDIASVTEWKSLLQVSAFFKKNVGFTEPVTSRLAAIVSFEEAEKQCEETNRRLDSFFHQPEIFPEWISKCIKSMEKEIGNLLGDHSSFLDELPRLVRFTTGATATRPRRLSQAFRKVSLRMLCTSRCAPYVEALTKYFGYPRQKCRIVRGNRVAFVPKSWKTQRTIACEPDGNISLQLTFDTFAKRQLRRWGINLSDQGLNQSLAREGSISDELSTIDLSRASDTLSLNLVHLLFPRDWAKFLTALRSDTYEMYPGLTETYSKFSSMGNGTTFPIETIVFAAACRS